MARQFVQSWIGPRVNSARHFDVKSWNCVTCLQHLPGIVINRLNFEVSNSMKELLTSFAILKLALLDNQITNIISKINLSSLLNIPSIKFKFNFLKCETGYPIICSEGYQQYGSCNHWIQHTFTCPLSSTTRTCFFHCYFLTVADHTVRNKCIVSHWAAWMRHGFNWSSDSIDSLHSFWCFGDYNNFSVFKSHHRQRDDALI